MGPGVPPMVLGLNSSVVGFSAAMRRALAPPALVDVARNTWERFRQDGKIGTSWEGQSDEQLVVGLAL